MSFSERLKTLRKQRNISQKELAKALNMSNGLIALYESEKRYPSRDRLEQIADYFNVSIDYLIGREKGSVYYLDPEVAQIAQELHDNEDLRILFDATRKATKDDLRIVIEVVNRMFGDRK